MWRAKFGVIALVLTTSAPLAAQQLSDPTAPPRVQSGNQGRVLAAGNLRLQSITWNDQQGVAQINGIRLKVGESLHEYTVKKIGMDQVTLVNSKTNDELILALFSGSGFELLPCQLIFSPVNWKLRVFSLAKTTLPI